MANEIEKRNEAFLIYQDDNGIARVNVRFEGDDVWLTERLVEPEQKSVMTDEEIKEGLKTAFAQLKEVEEGKRLTRNADELLYEL